MIIKNGMVLNDQWQFEPADILVEANRIKSIQKRSTVTGDPAQDGPSADRLNAEELSADWTDDDKIVDAAGCLVIPGLVDIHIHACAGHDFCDADPAAISVMAKHLAKQGVTTFLGTSMALGEKRLSQIFSVGQQVIKQGIAGGAQLRGIHMEGPFFAVEKKGAQSAEFIIDPDVELFKRLEHSADRQIKILDVAPERPGARELIAYAAEEMTVSIAHTVADYNAAIAAFQAGASHVTHLFNAMPPLNHRDPGVIGAASDAGATVELICDGVHLHPSIIRSVFKWFGEQKVVLVSDAMRACGLADGQYDLGGQTVHVNGNKATLADGTLAGSVTDLMQCVRNAVAFGIPLASAIRAATLNPATVAHLDQQVGSLAAGKTADLLVVDPDLNLKHVMIGGSLID